MSNSASVPVESVAFEDARSCIGRRIALFALTGAARASRQALRQRRPPLWKGRR
jgi:hypothetical protein